MKAARSIIALAVLALMTAFNVQAQGEASPQQKADVGAVKRTPPGPSTTTRTEQKEAAVDARKAGLIPEGECMPQQKMDAGACKKPAAPKSTKTRSEVKDKAIEARKAGTIPAGEMGVPQKRDEGVLKK